MPDNNERSSRAEKHKGSIAGEKKERHEHATEPTTKQERGAKQQRATNTERAWEQTAAGIGAAGAAGTEIAMAEVSSEIQRDKI